MLTLSNIPDIVLVVMLLGLTIIFVHKWFGKHKKLREVMVEKQLAKEKKRSKRKEKTQEP